MGELFATVSDIMFSLVIGYMGAIEFLYVMRHLYHWSFNHGDNDSGDSDENLVNLQQNLRSQLTEATNQENISGYNVMRDGISYKDGYRLDPSEVEGEKEREKPDKEIVQEKSERYKQLQEEYAEKEKLKEQIEEDLRKAEQAYNQTMMHYTKEAELSVQQAGYSKEMPEALEVMMEKSCDRDTKEVNRDDIPIEFEKEPQIRQKEIELTKLQQNTDHLVKASEDLPVEYDNGREAHNIERFKKPYSEQILQSTNDESKELLDIRGSVTEINDQHLESEILHIDAAETDPYVLLSIKPNLKDSDEIKDVYVLDTNDNERISDGSPLKLADQSSRDSVLENTIVKKPQEEFMEEIAMRGEIIEQINDQKFIDFSLKESPILLPQDEKTFPSEDRKVLLDSSLEESPTLFSQNEEMSPSEDTQMATNSSVKQPQTLLVECEKTYSSDAVNSGIGSNDASLRINFEQTQSDLSPSSAEHLILEDDDNVTPQLYTEDYLRSLDGIKNKKKDRSLHRRAFKKQRSSGSSNSSMESRTSRDEELEVFTSLEEEEMKRIGENFQPIIYTTEPPIKSKTPHSHKGRNKNSVSCVKEESNFVDENVQLKMDNSSDNSASNVINQETKINYKRTKEDSKDELNTTGALATSTKPKLTEENSSHFTSTLNPKCLNSIIIPEETYATALTQYDMDSGLWTNKHDSATEDVYDSYDIIKTKSLNSLEDSSFTESELLSQSDLTIEQRNVLDELNENEVNYHHEFESKNDMKKTGAIRKIPDDSIMAREENFEKMRRRNAEFRRSGSRSRSPLNDEQLNELVSIEIEAKEKQLQDVILDEISARRDIFENSQQLFMDHIASNRRASDSVLLVQKPGIVIQLQENIDTDLYVEPRDYHYLHNLPVHMENPNEDYTEDYIFVEEPINSEENEIIENDNKFSKGALELENVMQAEPERDTTENNDQSTLDESKSSSQRGQDVDIVIDESYKPNKKYKWRRKFKLLEENDNSNKEDKKENNVVKESENEDIEKVIEEKKVSAFHKPIDRVQILQKSDSLLILSSPFVEITSEEINNSFKTLKNSEIEPSNITLDDSLANEIETQSTNAHVFEEVDLKTTDEDFIKSSKLNENVKEENDADVEGADNKTPTKKKKKVKRTDTFDMLKDGNFYPLI